jgi:hypothetical protein
VTDYCRKHDLFDCWYCPAIPGVARPTVTTVGSQDVSTVKVLDGAYETVIFYEDGSSSNEGRCFDIETALRIHDEVVAKLRQDGVDTLSDAVLD